MSNNKEKNRPQHVLYESKFVGIKGLPFAIKDAQHLKVPLAIHKYDEKMVLEYIKNHELSFVIDVKII